MTIQASEEAMAIGTVRTRLRSVFLKTGVTRQSGLTRLLSGVFITA